MGTVTRLMTADIRTRLHVKCDCVPHLGPPHCHLCSQVDGKEKTWAQAHPDADDMETGGILMHEGDTVIYQGREYTVFRVMDIHVGLIDPTKEQMYARKENGDIIGPVAHFAVPKTEVSEK